MCGGLVESDEWIWGDPRTPLRHSLDLTFLDGPELQAMIRQVPAR